MENLNLENEPFFTEGVPEIRSHEGGKTTVFGHWAVYNSRSRKMRTKKGVEFVEVIKPGTFGNTDFSDLRSHFDHVVFLAAEPTLKYGFDERGAWYEYEHDSLDPNHMAALRAIQRGDAKGSSFQFSPLGKDCYTEEKEGAIMVRTITKIPRVAEVGPVVTPAYRGTTTYARSLDKAAEAEELEVQAEAEAAKLLEQRKLQIRATLM